MDNLFYRAWFHWVEFCGNFGFPWSKHATAMAAMAVMFYFIGIFYKLLTSRES